MNYVMLRKLRDELINKANRTSDEDALLRELTSLNSILNKVGFSISAPVKNCPVCGRPIME